MFLHEGLISSSFARLSEVDHQGKRGMERTSCLMYFLAFDELSARTSKDELLFDPETGVGLDNRGKFGSLYTNLVWIGRGIDSTEWFVTNLGSINTEGRRTPEKKLSGDFLTVPLKRASLSENPQGHPKRPSPLLLLGIPAYGKKWGISRHPNWKEHIVDFLSDRVSPSPWTDLAIFVFRDTPFENSSSLEGLLCELIKNRFSDDLYRFWKGRIASERRRFPTPSAWTQTKCSHALRKTIERERPNRDSKNDLLLENMALKKKIALLEAENEELRNKIL